jgi:cytochrome c-type biogenesis protein CcmH
MTTFVLSATALALLVAAAVVAPLRAPRGAGPRAVPAAVLVAVLVIGGAGAVYFARSNWSGAALPAGGVSELTELAQRARAAPADRAAWLRLAQAYVQAEQLPLALRAFEHVNALAGGQDPEALAGLGEALLLSGDESRVASAAGLFERALALEPHSAKALFYGGLLAMNDGRLEIARERFSAMLALDPPEQVRTALTGQIATIDRMLHPPVDPATLIDLQVELAPALRARRPAQGTLFVFVRNPAGGAPLAVRRLGPALPAQVQLSALDAVAGPGALQAGQAVDVIARISASGQPTAGPGDLYGQLRYRAGRDGRRRLLIDQAAP